MAFNIKEISVLAYSNDFTLWYYKTNDTINEVSSKNYFKEASNIMVKKDIIIIKGSIFNVNEHSVGFIEITNMIGIKQND